MHKRMTAVYCALVLLLTLSIYRIYYIDMSGYITAAAQVQGRYNLHIASTRGIIYDRNMSSLLGDGYRYVASVIPTPQAATALLERTPEEERAVLMQKLSGGTPFAVELPDNNIYAAGVEVFRIPQRYGGEQLAPHLLGYLGGDGNTGVAGIERAFDKYLQSCGGEVSVRYATDAAGRAMQGMGTELSRKNENPAGGVVLTLDAAIQRIVQNALAAGCRKGAAVVMDVYTGDILGMASLPDFDLSNIAASLDSQDAPFINRALCGYNIGSVFKLIVSAAALENKVSPERAYECKGYIDIDGQIFRCNNHAVHGALNMHRALQVSCNAYFIDLAQELGGRYILALAQHLGLGSASELAPGFTTQRGNLPTAEELGNPPTLANFSFGQGSSLATPLQMAQVVSAVANGGMGVTPRLVAGLTADGRTLAERSAVYTSSQVLSESTADILRELMVGVIEEGSGRTAKPIRGGAGGKTSSAQTGQPDGEGKEIVHAWFAGFFPAEKPRYATVVFVEGGESGEKIAAPIFKRIADAITGLNG